MKKSRRDVLRAAAVLAPFAAAAEEAPMLATATVTLAQAKHSAQSYGETWQYFAGRTVEFSLLSASAIRLNPGMAPHPPHRHPEPEIMLVTEGTGEILIDGRPETRWLPKICSSMRASRKAPSSICAPVTRWYSSGWPSLPPLLTC
jgi:hypothetical protein